MNPTCQSGRFARMYRVRVTAEHTPEEGDIVSPLQSHIHRIRGRKADDVHDDPQQVLQGLAPSLVIDLAKLAGSSLDDLQVTMQMMPWGDRATLAAYDIVELEADASRTSRQIKVLPVALTLVAAAAELVAEAVTPTAVARILSRHDLQGQAFDNVTPVEVTSPEALESSGDELITGKVEAVAIRDGAQVLEVALSGAAERGRGNDKTWTVLVRPVSKLAVRKSSPVTLSFEDGLAQKIAKTPRIKGKTVPP